MKRTTLLLAFLFILHLCTYANEFTLSSPDGNLKFSILDKQERLYFAVNYKDKEVVRESQLGINGNGEWKEGLLLSEEIRKINVNTSWKPVYGERSVVKDNYNELEVEIKNIKNEKRSLRLIIRAYNEGVAFQYYFPGGEYLHITNEYTEYTLPVGAKAYYTPRAQAVYQLLELRNWPGESERPLVVTLPNGLYALLTEAAMVDYARTKFALSKEKENTIISSMYGDVDDIAPYKTPWRVIMVAEKPGQLIENNDLILNLNPPCEIEQTWWIQPGKVMREVTLTTEGAKSVVDFAVKRNIQYVHFDAGWYGPEGSKDSDATTVTLDPARNPNPNALDLPEAIAYAHKHNIKVLLYVNQRALAQQLDELLPLYRSWGVSGIKFGFVQVGSHYWTKWLHEAVKKCAEYGLVLDIHDEYRPTGFSRTYPNLLTQEGIYGNEEFPDATNNTTLPFTRFTQGAGDYTICYYRQDFKGTGFSDKSHGLANVRLLKNTSSHQLALSVIYYSPLQFMYWYDKPSESQDEPELEFFDRVPTVWDDSRVVHGEIGEYITMARRSGDDWFVGTITNNDGRELEIPLNFLEPGLVYTAKIFYDDPKAKVRTKVGIKQITVTKDSVLKTKLVSSGGQAVWITQKK